MKNLSYSDMLKWGEEQLESELIADAKLDAWYLLEYVTGMTRATYFMDKDAMISEEDAKQYQGYIGKRRSHVPLQHITGEQEFMGLDFMVNEHVLIPRQDTETLVELALSHSAGSKVLDVCTGSGCIAIAIKILGKASLCDAVDLSSKALEVARFNAIHNNADIHFIESDMFQNVTRRYDIIVSNPPYIRPEVIETLTPEVREHDPMMALDGGVDGLEFYRILAQESMNYLTEDGMIMMEIGNDQGQQVSELFQENGYKDVKITKDLSGNDRVVSACMP